MCSTAAIIISAALPAWAIAVIIVLAVLFAAAAAGVVFLLLYKPKAGGKAAEKSVGEQPSETEERFETEQPQDEAKTEDGRE